MAFELKSAMRLITGAARVESNTIRRRGLMTVGMRSRRLYPMVVPLATVTHPTCQAPSFRQGCQQSIWKDATRCPNGMYYCNMMISNALASGMPMWRVSFVPDAAQYV